MFDAQGQKRSHTFFRVMMRSHAKLAYEEAQAAIDGRDNGVAQEILEGVLRPLWAAYRALVSARSDRQPLDLDLPERKILLNGEGKVDRVVVPDRLDAHRLIEEMMIQANVAAAETLERQKQALIYRAHDAPSLAKMESLRDFLRTLELPLAKAAISGRPFQRHPQGGARHRAREPRQRGGPALAKPGKLFAGEHRPLTASTSCVTRTSRRPSAATADLVVHRALVKALELRRRRHHSGRGGGARKDRRGDQSGRAPRHGRRARHGRPAHRQHLAGRLGEEFEGRITGVTRAGLFVQLPSYGADGFVPISTLGRDYFHYDEAAHTLVGERTRLGYRLGDTVEVKLVEAAPLSGAMRFEMLTEARELPGTTASFHKARPRARRPDRPFRAKNVAGKVRGKR